MPAPAEVVSYASYAQRADDGRFSAWLRHSAEPHWSRMIGHRFVRDMAADRLEPEVLERYLVYEYGFVRAAVKIFGYALIKTSNLADQTRLVRILDGLTGEQIDYFRATFDRLGVLPDKREPAELPGAVSAFCNEMLQLASNGSYEEILAAVAGAEWMYLTWCRDAEQTSPQNPVSAEWIAIHTAPAFSDQVRWLTGRLDELGPRLPAGRQTKLSGAFRRTLELEIGFHSAPYDEQRRASA